jgi:hypothetical protein
MHLETLRAPKFSSYFHSWQMLICVMPWKADNMCSLVDLEPLITECAGPCHWLLMIQELFEIIRFPEERKKTLNHFSIGRNNWECIIGQTSVRSLPWKLPSLFSFNSYYHRHFFNYRQVFRITTQRHGIKVRIVFVSWCSDSRRVGK